MIWWQFLVVMGAVWAAVLISVLVGAWFVFKAKTITMPAPFFQTPQLHPGKSHSYAGDLFEEDRDVFMDDFRLSPAAARLREQGGAADDDEIMRKVKGGK